MRLRRTPKMRLRQFSITGSFPGLVLTGFFFAALFLAFAIPAQADNAKPDRAVPGTLNYVEGKVSIGSQNVDSSAIGTAQVRMGESLTTRVGKAEVLLTPGVFLRVGDNSSVKMIATSITNTEVAVDRGHAMIEVAEIHPENDIRVEADGETTQLLKTGLYDFDVNQQEMRVFDGKARVHEPERFVNVKGGREVSLLSGPEAKPEKFDKKSYSGEDLYRWSSLRSAYVAEANVDAAGYYMANGIGTRGLTGSHLFLAMESSTARSVGDSILRGGCMSRRSTVTVDTGMAHRACTGVSAQQTIELGAGERTT